MGLAGITLPTAAHTALCSVLVARTVLALLRHFAMAKQCCHNIKALSNNPSKPGGCELPKGWEGTQPWHSPKPTQKISHTIGVTLSNKITPTDHLGTDYRPNFLKQSVKVIEESLHINMLLFGWKITNLQQNWSQTVRKTEIRDKWHEVPIYREIRTEFITQTLSCYQMFILLFSWNLSESHHHRAHVQVNISGIIKYSKRPCLGASTLTQD